MILIPIMIQVLEILLLARIWQPCCYYNRPCLSYVVYVCAHVCNAPAVGNPAMQNFKGYADNLCRQNGPRVGRPVYSDHLCRLPTPTILGGALKHFVYPPKLIYIEYLNWWSFFVVYILFLFSLKTYRYKILSTIT